MQQRYVFLHNLILFESEKLVKVIAKTLAFLYEKHNSPYFTLKLLLLKNKAFPIKYDVY